MMRRLIVTLLGAALLAAGAAAVRPASAQSPATPSPTALVMALRQGGYVIVMRHAASPTTPPSPEIANKDNPTRERQLDETGVKTARAMGAGLKARGVPVGQVWSSPTYRALQTARLAGLSNVKTAPELAEGGASMQTTSKAAADWLRSRTTARPAQGTNSFLITHFPNIRAAFPDQSAGLTDGEALVFKPDGSPQPRFVGRLPITAWSGG